MYAGPCLFVADFRYYSLLKVICFPMFSATDLRRPPNAMNHNSAIRVTTAFLRNLTLLWFALSSIPGLAGPPQACQCLWQGSFSQAQKEADVVLIGEIINRKGNSADLKIHSRFQTRPDVLPDFIDEIRFWGNNKQLCRPDISEFETGSQWVLALKRIETVPEGGFNPATPSFSYGREGDFYLSKCGANWLRIHEDFVTGNLVQGSRWSWDSPDKRPVLLKLVESYLRGDIPETALAEAASSNDKAKQLMLQTKTYLYQQ